MKTRIQHLRTCYTRIGRAKKDQQKLPQKEEFDEFDNSSQEKQMKAEVNHKNYVYPKFTVCFCIISTCSVP